MIVWRGKGGMEPKCRVPREEIVFGQLLFTVEFSHFGAHEIRHGVHQTSGDNRSRADAVR